jgi:hypothetical protein
MTVNRRDFITASAALGVLSLTKGSAQSQAVVRKKIGFVVSTKYEPSHEIAFLQGLMSKGWQAADKKATFRWLSAEGKYGHGARANTLKTHARNLRGQVDLIVTAGGLAAAAAVAQRLTEDNASTPFVFLIGRYPQSSETDSLAPALRASTLKVGGVDQNVPAQHSGNVNQLMSEGVSKGDIGLIVNDNNPMTLAEIATWNSISGINTMFQYHLTDINVDKAALPSLFKQVNALTPGGIIVSSDPYFRSVASEFVSQLRSSSGGNFHGVACYPAADFQEFDNEPNILSQNTAPLATEDPTDAKACYYQLGVKAADALDGVITTGTALSTWTSGAWTPGPFPT